jgi:hypothetical protein
VKEEDSWVRGRIHSPSWKQKKYNEFITLRWRRTNSCHLKERNSILAKCILRNRKWHLEEIANLEKSSWQIKRAYGIPQEFLCCIWKARIEFEDDRRVLVELVVCVCVCVWGCELCKFSFQVQWQLTLCYNNGKSFLNLLDTRISQGDLNAAFKVVVIDAQINTSY